MIWYNGSMFYEVIPEKGNGVLTYSSEKALKIGQIVVVPIGKRKSIGIVWKKASDVRFATKPIERVVCEIPLPKQAITGIEWLVKYYLVSESAAAGMFLPKIKATGKNLIMSRDKKERPTSDAEEILKTSMPPLNREQKQALKEIKIGSSTTKLLRGVTGSGKTNIYLRLASDVLSINKSVILLVPEIALVQQLVNSFQETFGKIVVTLHSKQTDKERREIWESLITTNEAKIIIGPRSALMSPLHNLGMIIIDEAHEGAYFQENSPKYSAIRLASFMAKSLGIDCILGSATPLVTDYFLAMQKNALISLTKKAKSTAVSPKVEIVDLRKRQNFLKNQYFSDILLKKIGRNLKNKEQSLIFHNRRGSSSLTICKECGWQALCPHCFLPLTLHADDFSLHCHTCGEVSSVPKGCPDCGCVNIIHKGFGTKLLEAELIKLFPKAKVARFDADNKKEDMLHEVYNEVKSGEFDILVGTQTLAKGLDLPKLATVGIVQADAGLSLPDFSAEERTFQLLTQVIGRVGRGHLETAEVVLQTYQPTSEVIQFAIHEDYEKFAQHLLEIRKKQKFPPFTYVARLEIVYKTEKLAVRRITELERILRAEEGLIVSKPMPAFHERSTSGFVWQLIVRSFSRKELVKGIKKAESLMPKLKITIDPPSLL